jgi:hypothetical protein
MTQDRYIFEEPPHVYAIAEDAYRSLLTEGVNQCIIIRHGSIIIITTATSLPLVFPSVCG